MRQFYQNKIAIIEDDKVIASLYEFKLEKSGFDVAVAHDGLAGLTLVESFRPELILLDLRMPVMSGDEMLANMRQQEWGGSVRVIVLTNVSRDEAPMSLRIFNIDRYLVKAHCTPTQVVQAIDQILGIRR